VSDEVFIALRCANSPLAGISGPDSRVLDAAVQYSAAMWLPERKESAGVPLTMHEHLAKGRGLHRFAFAALLCSPRRVQSDDAASIRLDPPTGLGRNGSAQR